MRTASSLRMCARSMIVSCCCCVLRYEQAGCTHSGSEWAAHIKFKCRCLYTNRDKVFRCAAWIELLMTCVVCVWLIRILLKLCKFQWLFDISENRHENIYLYFKQLCWNESIYIVIIGTYICIYIIKHGPLPAAIFSIYEAICRKYVCAYNNIRYVCQGPNDNFVYNILPSRRRLSAHRHFFSFKNHTSI